MGTDEKRPQTTEYLKKRKKLSGLFYEIALPNEYLVQIGKKDIKPILGGRKARLFRRFIRIPASVQTLYFTTDNANIDYQGIGIEGYASWRIDPNSPNIAITTLDFFDEDDPMARTNSELQTICIEAVRHVIANMTIDEALKKKDDIADNLKTQLKDIAQKWGIIFDQVGIEKVKIMSNEVFEHLQAQYRNLLRLEVEKTRIDIDRKIAGEENIMKEKTAMEKLETEKKLNLQKINNDTRVKEVELDEQRKITQKEYEISEEEYRREIAFKMEKEEKDYELALLENNLKIKLQKVEEQLLNSTKNIEETKSEISKKQLDIEKIKREIEQIFSSDLLTNKLIESLPEIYQAIRIDNYSILDSGSDEKISPIGKILNELIFILKNSGIDWLMKKTPSNEE